MSSLAELPELVGFFSYSRSDDEHSGGALSRLRDRIHDELRLQLGREVRLWQDTAAIPHGTLWEDQIKTAIAESVFFIPIVTPSAVASSHCKFEFESFLTRESALLRGDLVFPILYIRVPALGSEDQRRQNDVLEIIHARQYADWTKIRLDDVTSPAVGRQIERFCQDVVGALVKPWLSPEGRQRNKEEEHRRKEEAETRQQAEQKELRTDAEADAMRRAEEERRRQESNANRLEFVQGAAAPAPAGATNPADTTAQMPAATLAADLVPPSKSKRWTAIAAGAVVCAIAAGGAYLYSKSPPNPVPNDPTINSIHAQDDHPVAQPLSAAAVFDTRCNREDGAAFYDDFKSPDRAWGETGLNYYFNDGQMVLKAKENAIEPRIYLPLLFKNATICSEITTPSELKSANGSASAGIVFWAADYQNFYISVVFADSTYAVFRKAAGTWATVVPRTKADAVRPGPNAVNQVKVATGSNVASLFLNGTKIVEFWGQPPARGGSVGLYGQSEADTQNGWKFSSIAVARINDAAGPSAQALVPVQDTALLDACKPNASAAFFDDFNPHNPGWYAPADTHSFKDGQVIFKPKPKTNAQMFFPSLIFKSGTVCADIKLPFESKGSGGGGSLLFWAIDYQNYYSASVYPDGSYDVFRKIDGRWEEVITYTMAASIRKNGGAVNRMKVSFYNDLATVIVNDANLIQFRGQPPASGGFVGIAGQSDADENEWTFLNAVVMVDEKPAAPPTPPSVSAAAAAKACKPSSASVGFFDDFKPADPGWGNPGADNNFQDGRMVLKSRNAGTAWIYTPLVFRSATICSDFVSPSALEKTDGVAAGGIIFWAADYQNYYVAQTFTDGTYAIYRKVDGKWIAVCGRTKADDIRQGPGAVNRMRITIAGNKVTLFVNNKNLVELWGQSPSRGGAVGLYAQSETNQEEEWGFSNLVVLQDILEQPIYSGGAMAISAKCNYKASFAFFDDFKSLDPGWGSLPAVVSLKDDALNVKPAKNTSSPLIYFPLLFDRATFCSEIKSPPQFDNPADTGSAGIMFWAADYKNYYVALLGPDGTYSVSRRLDGDWVTVVPLSKATMINQGPDAVNRMKITIEPNAATISINDTIAIGFRGEPPAGGTAFGLYAESGTSQETLWRFTNLAVFD